MEIWQLPDGTTQLDTSWSAASKDQATVLRAISSGLRLERATVSQRTANPHARLDLPLPQDVDQVTIEIPELETLLVVSLLPGQ